MVRRKKRPMSSTRVTSSARATHEPGSDMGSSLLTGLRHVGARTVPRVHLWNMNGSPRFHAK